MQKLARDKWQKKLAETKIRKVCHIAVLSQSPPEEEYPWGEVVGNA